MTYTPQEQRAHREALVVALRSGEYAQAQGRLRKEQSYCCLGVACDLSGLGKWVMGSTTWLYVTPDARASHSLPDSVREYYGFRDHGGALSEEDGVASAALWRHNDAGMSFVEIADIIESEPEGLLTPEAAAWR